MVEKHNDMEYKCSKCEFFTESSKLLKEHTKEKHECVTVYLCEYCEFECKTKGELKHHLEDEHNRKSNMKSKQDNVFECCQCKKYFTTFEQLVAHTESSHELIVHSCNVCDYQTNLGQNLKEHYKLVHGGTSKKNLNMGPSPSEKSCNFEDPLHSTSCCDRKSGYRNPRLFSRQEKQNNGYCRFWNNGYCRMGDICKYLHEESPECYYQDRCQDNKCVYYHCMVFLAQGYSYRDEDFPELQRTFQNRK